MATKPTEEDGRRALRDHVLERALLARARYGPSIDMTAIRALLEDRELVRYPTSLVFDAAPLEPGEFAYAMPLAGHPRAGFQLVIDPRFEDAEDDLPLLVAYHIVAINDGDIATHEEAELFGATLLGMEVDEYYGRLCALMDGLGRFPV